MNRRQKLVVVLVVVTGGTALWAFLTGVGGESFRTRLGEETGLEPSDELVALERSLASGQPIANVDGRASYDKSRIAKHRSQKHGVCPSHVEICGCRIGQAWRNPSPC